MRAISMERDSRTVIEDTTSPRASFSLTLLRRMSLAATSGTPLMRPLCSQVGWPELGAKVMILGRSAECRSGQQGSECHEVRYQLQVGQRPGLAGGMAGAGRTGR